MGSPGSVWYSYSRFRQQQQRPLHPRDKYANQCRLSLFFRCLSLHQDKHVSNCESETHLNFQKYCQTFSVNPSCSRLYIIRPLRC